MKIINGLINFIDKIINHGILIILIILLFYSGYAIFDAHATYQKAELSGDILKYKPEENEMFSLAKIQNEINPDICGWIRIYNTNIDYPIVIGEDNTEYLNNDYRKEYSITGSIFLDYRNDRDLKDDYSIIYGHNLKKDLMFAQIRDYADKKYFDEHNTGILYTGDKIFKIDIIYFESINAYARPYSLMFCKNGSNASLLTEFEKNAINKNAIEVTSQDQLLLLSTCNSSDTETRSVLIGKLTEISNESEIINEKEDISLYEIDKQLSDREKYENVKEIIKDKEEKIDHKNHKYVIVILIVTAILIAIVIIFYIRKKKQDQNKKARHMKK